MKYQKGMKRYGKKGSSYKEDDKGSYYKGGDGKMYKMSAPGTSKQGNTPGQHDDHAHSHPDDNTDYPGSEEKGGKAKKSMSNVSEDDLEKTLTEIEDLYKSGDPEERKKVLLQKAQEGDLTADENEELLKSLRGGDELADADPTTSEQLTKSLSENESIQATVDVSSYLDEQHSELVKSLGSLGEIIDQSGRQQHGFNLVLAKGLHQTLTLVKSLTEQVEAFGSQPVGPPKSRGVRVPQAQAALNKSFAGADGGAPVSDGETLSKGDMLDTMTDMMEKSNGTAPCGEDITHSTAKYEQTSQMSKGMLNDILQFRRDNAH